MFIRYIINIVDIFYIILSLFIIAMSGVNKKRIFSKALLVLSIFGVIILYLNSEMIPYKLCLGSDNDSVSLYLFMLLAGVIYIISIVINITKLCKFTETETTESSELLKIILRLLTVTVIPAACIFIGVAKQYYMIRNCDAIVVFYSKRSENRLLDNVLFGYVITGNNVQRFDLMLTGDLHRVMDDDMIEAECLDNKSRAELGEYRVFVKTDDDIHILHGDKTIFIYDSDLGTYYRNTISECYYRQSAVQDPDVLQDAGDVSGDDADTDNPADAVLTPEQDDTLASNEVVQDIPAVTWRSAFEIYGKCCNTEETIEEIRPQLTENVTSKEELDADLKAMEELFTYWDGANEKDFVNSEISEDLPDDDSLCIVILGYSLSPYGEVRDELMCRLDAGIEAAKEYPNAYILVTGGGTALLAPSVKEADKMAEYLIEKGIDPSRIIVENNSLSTSENAVYSERLLRNDHPEISDMFIVTSDYHVPMACHIFEGWFIMKNSDLSVVSNYACHPGNPTVFRINDQVYWMEELLYFF